MKDKDFGVDLSKNTQGVIIFTNIEGFYLFKMKGKDFGIDLSQSIQGRAIGTGVEEGQIPTQYLSD